MKKFVLIGFIALFLIAGCQQQAQAPQDQNMADLSDDNNVPAGQEDLPPSEDTNMDVPEQDSETTNNEGTQSPMIQKFRMEAFSFGWEPETITVKKGVPVRITAVSTDVDHGIAIPQFGVSETLPAGEEVTFEFVPDKTGEFTFFCNVYCGSGHSSMRGTLIVE